MLFTERGSRFKESLSGGIISNHCLQKISFNSLRMPYVSNVQSVNNTLWLMFHFTDVHILTF